MDVNHWRALWRRRGLALDRCLPRFFSVPAPAITRLASLVPRSVSLPGGHRARVDEDDMLIVVEALLYISDFMEHCFLLQNANSRPVPLDRPLHRGEGMT